VVESDQKGRGYEVGKGEYVEGRKGGTGGRSGREQPHHRHRQALCRGTRSTGDTSIILTIYRAPMEKAGVDAFAVIRDAMKDKDRVALGAHRIVEPGARHRDRAARQRVARHHAALPLRTA